MKIWPVATKPVIKKAATQDPRSSAENNTSDYSRNKLNENGGGILGLGYSTSPCI